MPPDAQIALDLGVMIIGAAPLTRWEISRAVAEDRYLTAVLMRAGLDPRFFTPEDAQLLNENKDGNLIAQDEYVREHDKALAYSKGYQ
jgi:hypothetical protein